MDLQDRAIQNLQTKLAEVSMIFDMNAKITTQKIVDEFYKKNGPCCAGCDWWRWHNSVVGECTKSAPVAARERWSMLGYDETNLHADAGHIMTKRDHVCGDFVDTYEWPR